MFLDFFTEIGERVYYAVCVSLLSEKTKTQKKGEEEEIGSEEIQEEAIM